MTNKKYQIFISSTFEDLKKERNSAIEAILMTNNIPVGMEAFVASSKEQFEYIKNCINDSDYYIIIVGGRYGSLHPELNLSYTELEFDYAKSVGKPMLCFVCKDLNKCRKKDSELENIINFRNKVQKELMCTLFNNDIELKDLILTALTREIETNPQIGWIRSNENTSHHKLKKDCVLDLIKTGEAMFPEASLYDRQWQQFGSLTGPFNNEYVFCIWRQKINEFLSLNNLSQKYYFSFNGTLPYSTVIKKQLVLLQGLLSSLDYQEILK